MSLNPFGGMGRGILGGFVGRALGLGSNSPVIQGITAFAMIVALGLFAVKEFYELRSVFAQSNAQNYRLFENSTGNPLKDYTELKNEFEATGGPDGKPCDITKKPLSKPLDEGEAHDPAACRIPFTPGFN